MGMRIGAVARSQHPGGVMITDDRNDLVAAEERTRFAITNEADISIYEATFSHKGLLVQSDILVPEGTLSIYAPYRMCVLSSRRWLKYCAT